MGLDANGIHQYTEGETRSPFSTFLNRLAASVSTQIGLLKTAVTALKNGPWTALTLASGATVATSTWAYRALVYRTENGGTDVRLRNTRLALAAPLNTVVAGTDYTIATGLPALPAAGWLLYGYAFVYNSGTSPLIARLTYTGTGQLQYRASAGGTASWIDIPDQVFEVAPA